MRLFRNGCRTRSAASTNSLGSPPAGFGDHSCVDLPLAGTASSTTPCHLESGLALMAITCSDEVACVSARV